MLSNCFVRTLLLMIFTFSVNGVAQEIELKQETYSLQGICVQGGEEKEGETEPSSTVPNVELKLFYVDTLSRTQKLVASKTSTMRGTFRFDGLKNLKKNSNRSLPTRYVLLARAEGFATVRMRDREWIRNKNNAKLIFSKAGKIGGRFTDPKGKPIAGVEIYDGRFIVGPVPGFTFAKTVATGKFELTDVPQPKDESEKRVRSVAFFSCSHPDYGRFSVLIRDTSTPTNIQLSPAYKVKGKVMDAETGRPKSNCIVVASLARGKFLRRPPRNHAEGSHWVTALTNKKGEYMFSLFADSDYNVFTMDDEKNAAAISISNHGPNTAVLEDIRLSNPVEVKGQLIDSETGKPITRAVRISWHGPDRPKSGAPVNGTISNDDGSFTLKMVAGKNTPYVATADTEFQWKSISIRDGNERVEEIDVSRGHDLDLKIVVQKTKL